MFGQDRNQLRAVYVEAWKEYRQGKPLNPLQIQIVAVIRQHPEYQGLLENSDQALGRDYLPENGETNPFLHMGMHLALQDQVSTDRPAGIRALYERLQAGTTDSHTLQHKLMECLAEMIWQAQREGELPDEQRYLDCIGNLAGNGRIAH
ncbi:MAG TPA: DUF1841 family protein [Gammaproteobacteria bacterium]|nr:DUF1841 family protein [Gammaproteobacteria bacterium]